MSYITKEGQTWDEIAKEIYGKEILADILMKNNPKQLGIFIFPSGIELNTPDVEIENREELPSWRIK